VLSRARRSAVRCLARARTRRQRGEPLEPGQVYEANSVLLGAVFRAAGADVEHLTGGPDAERWHGRALERGLRADVLVTSGGVSVGQHDLVRRILAELGVEEV